MREAHANVIRLFRHLKVTGPHRRTPNRRACNTGKWSRGRCSLQWSAKAHKCSQQNKDRCIARYTESTSLRTLHALPATTER